MAPATPRTTGDALRSTLRRHIRRAAGREANPLSRHSDVRRSRIAIALTLALAVALALAMLTALDVLRIDQRQARYEGQHRHRTIATTVEAAVPDAPGARTGTGGFHAQAVWQFPPATRGGGPVAVAAAAAAGTEIAVWVDDHGHPASAPLPATEVVTRAVLAGAGVMAVLPARRSRFTCSGAA
ncbi:hypothetical protein [Kitasatospora sp. MBT63]|uniref:hypothetical protein n=1 Tax=Kitasatospora sp. MBT63 TaxID=1444768 RepID=UPI00053B8321|nr:hypothetical protein [Kitasatospora sp. MBT63]